MPKAVVMTTIKIVMMTTTTMVMKVMKIIISMMISAHDFKRKEPVLLSLLK